MLLALIVFLFLLCIIIQLRIVYLLQLIKEIFQEKFKPLDTQLPNPPAKITLNHSKDIDPIELQCSEMLKMFFSSISNDNQWKQISSNTKINIYSSDTSDSTTQIMLKSLLQYTPETIFDFITDVENRHKWDPSTIKIQKLHTFPNGAIIYYIKISISNSLEKKGGWLLSSFSKGLVKDRDMVVLCFHSKVFKQNNEPDGYLTVSKSIEWNKAPTTEEEDTTRMNIKLSGQWVKQSNNNENYSELIQFSNVDIGGFVPLSIINYFTTSSLPRQITRKFNIILLLI